MSTVLPAGVKETTGERFNRDDPFTYFLASSDSMSPRWTYKSMLVAVNELKSRADVDSLERALDRGVRVMLDSGIFNLAMEHVRKHGTTHDYALSMAPEEIDGFSELWDRYGTIVTEYGHRMWGIVELDQGGAAHKPATRSRIEAEFGIVPMPVYHPLLDGRDYFDSLATNYDRICFGNIVQASPKMRQRIMHTAFEQGRRYPYLWMHLLGLYPNETLLHFPIRGSCDSSSWLTPIRWLKSWRPWSMLKSLGTHRPAMWSHASDEAYDRRAGESVCESDSFYVQRTILDIWGDLK